MDFANTSGASYPSAQHPPVLISRKIGSTLQPWRNVDAGSLGSRYIGKVLVDCKFRFAESRWGVLGPSKTPAGVIYVDLGFHQPKEYKLASASVQISLHEHVTPPLRKKGKGKRDDVASHLVVTDRFGPKMLAGKPVVSLGKTSYSLMPKVGAMGVSVGGMGINKDMTATFSSQWAIKGYSVATDGDGVPGAVYRTLRWELSEHDFASPPVHSNVVHTGLAFTHDDQPFYLKVEIQGKLRNISDRLRFAFPPRRHRQQGTTLTLVGLGPQHNSGLPLDDLTQNLEEDMVQKNLRATPRKLPDCSPAAPGESNISGHTTRSNVAIPPSRTDPERTPSKPDVLGSSGSAQSSIVERLSEALSAFPVSDNLEPEDTKDMTHSPVTVTEVQVPEKDVLAEPEVKDVVKRDAETAEEKLRRLTAYPSVIALLHVITLLLDLFGAAKRVSKISASRSAK